MRDGKLILCAAFFLLLAVLRLLFPDQAAQAQDWVTTTVDPMGNIRTVSLTLGKGLSGIGLMDRLSAFMQWSLEAFS